MGTHWRSMQDREFLGVWSLQRGGKQVDEVTLTIERVEAATVKSAEKPKGDKCPVLYFRGVKKPMVCNSTNGKTLEGMFGPYVEEWAGKNVTLYAGDVRNPKGGTMKGLRIRQRRPTAPAETLPDVPTDEAARAANKAAFEEPGDDHGDAYEGPAA